MKKKTTSIIALFSCIVLLLSILTACKNKKDIENPSEIAADESWYPGVDSTYEPVTIGSVELADIVKEALGDEAKDFNGDLTALTADQLKKVEELAEKKGYEIDTNEQGKPVIKDPSYAEASFEEKKEIYDAASVKDPNNLSADDIKNISKVAAQNGATAITDKNGTVDIVKPAPTTKPPKATTTKKGGSPNKPPIEPKTTEGYVSPMGTTLVRTKAANCTWKSTYSTQTNDTFINSAIANDGIVSVGTSFKSTDEKAAATNVALIAKYDKNGQKMWSHNEGKSESTAFEKVAILTDGSIIAVGYTTSDDIAPASAYKCPGTVEGLVVKYSANGKKEWLKIIGGSNSDSVYSVAATPDGGFVIGGNSFSQDGDLKDIVSEEISSFLFKCDADGNILWRKALSGTMHSATDEIAVTPSGYIYATISVYASTGDYALIEGLCPYGPATAVAKYAPDGTIQWIRGFSGSGATELESIAVTKDGGCIVAGQYSTGSDGKNTGIFKDYHNGGMPLTTDGAIIKIAPNGKTQWLTTLVGYESDYITGITSVPGGYAVSGYTTSSNRDFLSNSGDYDSFVYVVSEYGEKQTVSSFGGSNSDTARGIIGDGTKTVYLCGISFSGDGYFADCADKGNENCAVAYLFRYDLDQGAK